jgi:hypothetical protein
VEAVVATSGGVDQVPRYTSYEVAPGEAFHVRSGVTGTRLAPGAGAINTGPGGAPVGAWFVSEKLAVFATPCTEAVTVYEPCIQLAVASVVAMPLLLLTTVAAVNVAEAPLAGAVNVTLTPEMALL